MIPIQFKEILTRRDLVEELEEIEREIDPLTAVGRRVHELRLAVESKPIEIDVQ